MLPIYIEFGVQTPDLESKTTHKYVQKLRTWLHLAYKIAQYIIKKEQECAKRHVMIEIFCSKLEPGDWIPVRQKAYKRKHKIKRLVGEHPLSCSAPNPVRLTCGGSTNP